MPLWASLGKLIVINYLTIRGGSLKKIEKKIIPKVPTNKKVYTKASIKSKFYFLKIKATFVF